MKYTGPNPKAILILGSDPDQDLSFINVDANGNLIVS